MEDLVEFTCGMTRFCASLLGGFLITVSIFFLWKLVKSSNSKGATLGNIYFPRKLSIYSRFSNLLPRGQQNNLLLLFKFLLFERLFPPCHFSFYIFVLILSFFLINLASCLSVSLIFSTKNPHKKAQQGFDLLIRTSLFLFSISLVSGLNFNIFFLVFDFIFTVLFLSFWTANLNRSMQTDLWKGVQRKVEFADLERQDENTPKSGETLH